MVEIINAIMQNQYIQIVLSLIQFIGWGAIAAFIVAIVTYVRRLKRKVNNDVLQKADIVALSEKHDESVEQIKNLKREIQALHDYNKATNDAVAILLLTSRRVNADSKLAFAQRVKELADSEAVLKAADAVIDVDHSTAGNTEEDIDEEKSATSADATDALLAKLGLEV